MKRFGASKLTMDVSRGFRVPTLFLGLSLFQSADCSDTSYRASSGDILHGMGYVKFGFEDSTLAISGKYSEPKHTRTDPDSSFKFLLKDRGHRYEEKVLNTDFQWVNEADLTKLKSRWGATGL